MRALLYLIFASMGAALPMQSVPLAGPAAASVEVPVADGRGVPGAAAGFYSMREATVTADDVEGLAAALGQILPLTAVYGGKSDLLLLDGRLLKAARIVAIGETAATVLHAEGLTDVEIKLVPVAVLERAREEIAAAAAVLKRIEAEFEARAVARIQEGEARRLAELQERLALATFRPEVPGATQEDILQRQTTDPLQRLLALQEKFPARKKGRNELGIEFDVPPRSVWSFYQSYFLATALDQLPETLAILEARRTQDLAAWDWKAKSSASISKSAEHVQAQQTVVWLSEILRAYLQEARLLTRTR
jgi:hypothetical protein